MKQSCKVKLGMGSKIGVVSARSSDTSQEIAKETFKTALRQSTMVGAESVSQRNTMNGRAEKLLVEGLMRALCEGMIRREQRKHLFESGQPNRKKN